MRARPPRPPAPLRELFFEPFFEDDLEELFLRVARPEAAFVFDAAFLRWDFFLVRPRGASSSES